jgi:hypothetical protein
MQLVTRAARDKAIISTVRLQHKQAGDLLKAGLKQAIVNYPV